MSVNEGIPLAVAEAVKIRATNMEADADSNVTHTSVTMTDKLPIATA